MNPLQPLNDPILLHARLQTSPRHASLLNRTPIRSVDACNALQHFARWPMKSGYKLMFTGYAEHVLRQAAHGSKTLYLCKALSNLRANPRPSHAFSLRGSVDTYSISNEYFRIDYRVHSGQVTVHNIQPVDRVQRMRDFIEQTALYTVSKNSSGVWQVGAKVEQVNTVYAAVNGQSNNLTKAVWLMGSHLEYEFAAIREYTLFHNPSRGGLSDTWESVQDKFGFTTAVTKTFARTLASAQRRGNKTQWVAHSQGGLIFTEAVRYLLNDGSSWPLNSFSLNGIRHQQKEQLLDQHSVAFHGNANNNLRCKPLLKRAGITISNIVAHDFDLVTNVIGGNTLHPKELVGSLLYANLVMGGSVMQSPHTLAQSMASWQHHMDNGLGKGRNGLQNAAHKTTRALDRATQWIKNYLP